MTNKEVLEKYNTEQWVVEQTLCFMLMEYWEKHCAERFHRSQLPENPVSFIKKFMQEETISDIEYAEQSKLNTLKQREVITIDDCPEI